MKHTIEPWSYHKTNGSPTTGMHMIAGGKPGYLAEVRDCGSGDVVQNARRIVACVNACAGVTTEELEQGGFVSGLLERIAEAPRWRDVADELPQEAQEVLFVRGGKTVHGAWIGGIFWHSNQKMAAAKWMPMPKPPEVGAGETAVQGDMLLPANA